MQFIVDFSSDGTYRTELAALYPENVFSSVGYSRAIDGGRGKLALLGIQDEAGHLIEGCYGLFSFGRLTNTLEISSLPQLSHGEIFFRELQIACAEQRITRLAVSTFGSPAGVTIPTIGWGQTRSARFEYALDLTLPDPLAGLSKNHRRNMKKGQKAGLQVSSCGDRDAIEPHLELMGASIDRRAGRGEAIGSNLNPDDYLKFVDAGAGRFHQSRLNDEVVSSILVLHAEQGAYYHSAGTSPAGMKIGASVHLIAEIATRLKRDGSRVFNLGGARPEQEGLRRFKSSFGATEVSLESGKSYFGNRLRHGLVAAVNRLRG